MPSHFKTCTLTSNGLYVSRQMFVSAFRFLYHRLFILCALSPLSVSPDCHGEEVAFHKAPLASRLFISSQYTCNTTPSVYHNRQSHSFASTISTCCSAWAWDHDCHITAYDLSRQRRRSVILVYIPHEITVQLQLSSQTVALSGL